MKPISQIVVILLSIANLVQAGPLVNVDKKGLALQGHDPVAYFTLHRPLKGNPAFTAAHEGATYHFASVDHLSLFQANPEKYVPQFGGFCGYAASINQIANADPSYWQVIDGRLILQKNQEAWNLWSRDVTGNLKKADGNWPALSLRKPGFFGWL